MSSLRFVEINGNRKNIEILENLPSQIIGHKGEIKPQISNGHISRHHATVCYDPTDESWTVFDGEATSGVASRNGLKDQNGEDIVGKVTLREIGDRVYILYMYNTNAYLEVFATSQERADATQDFEHETVQPEISKLVVNTSLIKSDVGLALKIANDSQDRITEANKNQGVVIDKIDKTQAIVATNTEHLQDVDKKQIEQAEKLNTIMTMLDQGLNHVEDIGNKPKQYFIGFSVFTLGAIFMISLYGIYRNIDPIVESIFRIENTNPKK